MSIATAAATVTEEPETKKIRLSLPTQVVVQRPDFDYYQVSPICKSMNGIQSPKLPSSASSLTPALFINEIKNEDTADAVETSTQNGQNLADVLSTAMMFQANAFFKSNLALIQQPTQQIVMGCGRVSKTSSSPDAASGPPIPGALAVAANPAAALFKEDDWSWHRNPAAAIRSGGTNKQTPVWKYFVYNKLENLSRCIVGDCTYMLKGPHTSTLACHLKKHPAEYAEFQKLKLEYTRERNGGVVSQSSDLSSSGSSASSKCSATRGTSSINCSTKQKKMNESSNDALNLCRNISSRSKASCNFSNIFNLWNASANISAVLASGNGNLLQNPLGTILNPNALAGTNCNENIAMNLNIKSEFPYNGSSMMNLLASSLANSGNSSNNRKWGRDDRRQKEVEIKIALMLSAIHLPLSLIDNTYFREFLEFLLPKFRVPKDVAYIEELISIQYSQMLVSLQSQLALAKRVAIMVDVLRLPSLLPEDRGGGKFQGNALVKNEDQFVRLCVSAAYFNPITQLMDVVLLGIRPLVRSETIANSVQATVHQLLLDFNIIPEKVSKYLLNGIRELIGDCYNTQGNPFSNSLESYNQKLTQSLTNVVDMNATIEELKANFYNMFLNFVSRPGALQLLRRTIGSTIPLSITESFLFLVENVLSVKDAFLAVCSHISTSEPIEIISNEQWQMLEGVSRLLKLFRTHMSVIQDNRYATIDGVVPSLMQLQLSLHKEFSSLGDLPEQLRLDLQKRTTFVLDINSEGFNGSYIQATALNPHLAILLDDEQLAYSKKALIQEVTLELQGIRNLCKNSHVLDVGEVLCRNTLKYLANCEFKLSKRMRIIEDDGIRQSSKRNIGVDSILSSIADRNFNSSSLSISTKSTELLDEKETGLISASAVLYPDLIHAANERRKVLKEKLQTGSHNRYAEAIVQSYFEEIITGSERPVSPLFSRTSSDSHNLPPMQFWLHNSMKFGILSEIAIELLTTPASTITLERIFATSVTDEQNGLSSQSVVPPISFLRSTDDTQVERDVMLRFNRLILSRI